MTQRGRLLAVLLLGLVFGLLAFVPARLVGSLVATASAGRLLLEETEGTLWRGQGRLFLRAETAVVPLGRLHWRASAPGLLLGRLNLAGEQLLAERQGSFQVSLAPGGASFSALDIGLPAEMLAGVSPLLAALQPAGRLGLRSEGFSVARGRGLEGFSGALQIDWQPASFLAGVQAGDYRVTVQGDGKAPLQAKLATLSGGLRVEGELNLAGRAGVQMSARVRLMPDADRARLMPVFRALCSRGTDECSLPAAGR